MRAIRVLILLMAFYLLMRVISAGAEAQSMTRELTSGPRSTIAAVAVLLVCAWGLYRVLQDREGG